MAHCILLVAAAINIINVPRFISLYTNKKGSNLYGMSLFILW